MNTKLVRAFLALGILFVYGQANAIPVLMQYIVTFSNSGDTLGAGLTIDARTTDTSRLIIAGGFTIRCAYSSLQIDEENHSALTGFTQVRFVVKVPGPLKPSPSSFPVLGWSQIPAASCADCTMTHKSQARDETTLSASVGIQNQGFNAGANFTLVPTGEIGSTSTEVHTQVCRPGQPQCCTAGCQLP